MFGLRGVGALGASVALAGGVAYLAWSYASSTGEKKPEVPPGRGGESAREEGESREEERREETEAEPSVVASTSPQTSQEDTTCKTQKAGSSILKSKPLESGGRQVLVLGLDGAGKTSLLQCLATGHLEQDVEPTQGFNAVSVTREDLHIEFLEIGGKEELRPYWQKYMSKALLLVFVVDASSPQIFPVAKKHLHELLASDSHLPLMVLANKQDLPGSCSITDLHEALSLSEVGERRLFLIGTHVKKGEAELSSGVQDAHDLIIQMVCERR